MTRFARLARLGQTLLLVGCCTAIWAEISAYSNNTLVTNGHWLARRIGFMGAAFNNVTQRQVLSGNVLNLGGSIGHQEYISRNEKTPLHVSFRFRLLAPSFLDLTFNHTPSGYEGMRFSRSAVYPSTAYRSERSEKWTYSTRTELPSLDTSWHWAVLDSSPQGLTLSLDQKPVGTFPGFSFGPGGVGFRGGLQSQAKPVAQVSAVVERFADGTVMSEDFRNRKGWGVYFLASLALLALFTGVSARFRRSALSERARTMAIRGIALGALYFAFDFLLWSRVLFVPAPDWLVPGADAPIAGQQQQVLEMGRAALFEAWFRLLGLHTLPDVPPQGLPELQKSIYQEPNEPWGPDVVCEPRYPACIGFRPQNSKAFIPNSKGGYRVLFLGGSQLAGAGANYLAETSFFLTHRWLSAHLTTGTPLESINLASGGTSPAQEIIEYLNAMDWLNPDVVVAGLFSFSEASLSDALYADFLDRNRAAGIRTVLLIRAGDPELAQDLALGEGIPRGRAELALGKGAAIYEENELFRDSRVRAGGLLFWDGFQHLTAYGQETLSNWLAPSILQALLAHPPRKSR